MDLSQVILPVFPNISLSFLANTPLLLIIFIAFFIVYLIITIVLVYHWVEYGMRNGAVVLAELVFVLVSTVLFIISFLALNYI